jgi:hypothetical protein
VTYGRLGSVVEWLGLHLDRVTFRSKQ